MIRVNGNVLWEIFAGNNVTLYFIPSVLEFFFFGFFVDTSRILSNRFWGRMPEQDFMLSLITFAKKTKNFNFKTCHWVWRTIFWKGWQNHFPLIQWHYLGTKCFFLTENLHFEVSNLFFEKITKFEQKIPQCGQNCFKWTRRNYLEKKFFVKKLFVQEFVSTIGLEF